METCSPKHSRLILAIRHIAILAIGNALGAPDWRIQNSDRA